MATYLLLGTQPATLLVTAQHLTDLPVETHPSNPLPVKPFQPLLLLVRTHHVSSLLLRIHPDDTLAVGTHTITAFLFSSPRQCFTGHDPPIHYVTGQDPSQCLTSQTTQPCLYLSGPTQPILYCFEPTLQVFAWVGSDQ